MSCASPSSLRPLKSEISARDTFEIEPCPADVALLELLAAQRYDRLNHTVNEGVYRTYQSEMWSSCTEMLKNERILGRVVPNDDDAEFLDNEGWFQDPKDLTSFELFQAITQLSFRIDRQKRVNETAQTDLDVLTLARDSLNLEVGFKVVELITEEQKT
jgi:hypothetical protein